MPGQKNCLSGVFCLQENVLLHLAKDCFAVVIIGTKRTDEKSFICTVNVNGPAKIIQNPSPVCYRQRERPFPSGIRSPSPVYIP